MGNITIVLISLIALAGALGNAPDEVQSVYSEAIATGRYMATAGDLRSISNMLDYEYLRRGRYPRQDHFALWMSKNFKESQIKEITHDHWDRPLRYVVAKDLQSYTLTSYGPDGTADNEDDLYVTGP
nr:type II secretion system protein GspG [uncultured Desulfuromonas sp.]